MTDLATISRDTARLVKLPLSTAIAAAALSGYLIQNVRPEAAALQLFFGLWLLACGCAGLNNVQDRRLDARSSRTCSRPLPAGRITVPVALTISLSLMGIGLFQLAALDDRSVWRLGLLGAVCYNLLYTPLKPRTAWALLPGVICGMLPPWMGWIAAGGPPFSVTIWIVMAIFGVWQLPHFWLLVLAHRSDFSTAGLPTLFNRLSTAQADRVLLVWATGVATLTLCLPLGRLIHTDTALAALSLNAAWLVIAFCRRLLTAGRRPAYRRLFAHLNLSVFFSLAVAVVERALL